MCPLAYGTDGIRSRDYKVWFNYIDDANYVDAVNDLEDFFIDYDNGDLESAYDMLVSLKTKMYHVGEMRADSIELMCEDGGSIEGNVLGKIVMSKNCRFSAELINATTDNISGILAADGKECIIFLEETNDKRIVFFDPLYLYGQELIFLCNKTAILDGETDNVGAIFSFSERITGSGIPLVIMSTEREVPAISHFRKILDLPYEDAIDAIDDLNSAAGDVTDTTELIFTPTIDTRADGLRLEIAETDEFLKIEHTLNITDIDGTYVATLDYATYNGHYIRACFTRNGLQISAWSNSEKLAIKSA